MLRTRSWLALLALWFCAAPVAARDTYPPLLPNRAYTYSTNEGIDRPCITCHNNPDGGQGCIKADGSGGQAPCWNLFGGPFNDNARVWNATLAALDSDGDGFTNGQELQDPLGLWREGDPPIGNPDYVTRPGYPDSSPGLHDEDDDEVCWFGRDLNDDGDCIDQGEPSTGYDCDDSNANINSQVAQNCAQNVDTDCDGRPPLTDTDCAAVMDNDDDGFCETGVDANNDRDCVDPGEESDSEFDCDDDRATVYWGAPENCIDGLDNDCNGDIDFDDLLQCDDKDDDRDGYCPVGRDNIIVDFSCDEQEIAAYDGPGDCYDVAGDESSANISPAATELCTDGLDNNCNGDADFEDEACRHLVDADQDGYCPEGRDLNADRDCADTNEATADVDCDDENVQRRPGGSEVCYDGVDRDCDGDVALDDSDCAGFYDDDNDGYCLNGQDINDDRDCLDGNLFGTNEYTLGLRYDCDESSTVARPRSSELLADFAGCFDGIDTDCDGAADAEDPECFEYADSDGDGYCVYGIDGNADGDCTDEGEHNDRATIEDCKEGNAAFAPGIQENCTDKQDNNCDGLVDRLQGKADPNCTNDVDADADGFCPIGRDLDADGKCTGPGENVGSDCNDQNDAVNTDSRENSAKLCKDLLDNDCDGLADAVDTEAEDCGAFLDQDHDGFCPAGTDLNFNGRCLEGGEQTAARDCNDGESGAFPGKSEVCGDGLDNDCNGLVDANDTDVCGCTEDDECTSADACFVGSCENERCTYEIVAACADAGMPEPDAGHPQHEVDAGHADAGHDHEEDAGTDEDGDEDDDPPPPKPSSCSVSVEAPAQQGAWLGLTLLGLIIGLGCRRRSKS